MKFFQTGAAKVAIPIALIACFLAGIGVMYFLKGMAYVTTDDAYVDGRIHYIAPKISGTVKKVLVTDNQKVKKGDSLVEIDPADYEVKVKEAEAALSAEQARLQDAEAKISGARANLEIQEATLKQAGQDKTRAQRLFAEGALSKDKIEKAETAFTLAAAQVKAAKELIAQAQANKELEVSLVKQREAVRDTAKLNFGYTKVMSPADGVVTKKAAEEGNQVQAGQPLMAVVALDDVWITANYKETQLKDVKPGQEVIVHVDTYGGRELAGKVDSIMAGSGAAFSLFPPENALGNYVKVVQRIPVKIVLDKASDPDHVLRVGMSVIAKIKIK